MNIDTGEVLPLEQAPKGNPNWVEVPTRLRAQVARYSLSAAPLTGRGTLARWARKERAKRKKAKHSAAQARRRNRA